jgi:hypothetical protein
MNGTPDGELIGGSVGRATSPDASGTKVHATAFEGGGALEGRTVVQAEMARTTARIPIIFIESHHACARGSVRVASLMRQRGQGYGDGEGAGLKVHAWPAGKSALSVTSPSDRRVTCVEHSSLGVPITPRSYVANQVVIE